MDLIYRVHKPGARFLLTLVTHVSYHSEKFKNKREGFMKKLLAYLTLAFILSAARLYASDYVILQTLDDKTAAPYQVVSQIGVQGEEQIDQSTLIHGPTFDTAFGVGEWAEVGLNSELLSLSDSPSFSNNTGSGDVRIRVKAIPIQAEWGNLGFAGIAKIPSANDGRGLGTDEADIVLKAIYGKTLMGDLRLFVNLGVAIQGDPSTNSSQDDYFVWGVGAEYPFPVLGGCTFCEGLSLIAEFEGSVGPEDHTNVASGQYTDGDAEFRGGLVKRLPWFNLAATGSVGITDNSPDWGFAVTISRAFDLPVLFHE